MQSPRCAARPLLRGGEEKGTRGSARNDSLIILAEGDGEHARPHAENMDKLYRLVVRARPTCGGSETCRAPRIT
jgi:hypothetical protein